MIALVLKVQFTNAACQQGPVLHQKIQKVQLLEATYFVSAQALHERCKLSLSLQRAVDRLDNSMTVCMCCYRSLYIYTYIYIYTYTLHIHVYIYTSLHGWMDLTPDLSSANTLDSLYEAMSRCQPLSLLGP